MAKKMTNFDRAFTELLGHEGGYTNHPDDPGGETNWGITVAVARENGYIGSMKDMDQSVAKAVYAKQYWLPAFDQLPYAVAFQVFDAAVNSGTSTVHLGVGPTAAAAQANAVAATAGNPAAGIPLVAGAVEVLRFPLGSYFSGAASGATTVYLTPGEGL